MRKSVSGVFILVILCRFVSNGQLLETRLIDSARQEVFQMTHQDAAYVRSCIFISDAFMDLNRYDSAQTWLNKLYKALPEGQASLFNYFKVARQAMIYYYNNLPQLGIQEAMRAAGIARSLNDSILLADNSNFFGLFYMLLDSNKTAVGYFQEGLKFVRQPPYPEQYISLTKPHNLYGNLSEAYYKSGQYTDAFNNARYSLISAGELQSNRGMIVARNSMGDAIFAMGQCDSAESLYNEVLVHAASVSDRDIKLITYAGLAQCYDARKNYKKARFALNKGLLMLRSGQSINSYYSLRFLNKGIDLFRNQRSYQELSTFQQIRDSIETRTAQQSSAQIQSIIFSSLANETRMLHLKVQDVVSRENLFRTRIVLALLIAIVLLMALVLSRYYLRQQLRSSELRNRISRDLHDDIGASLSSIQMFGDLATSVWDLRPTESRSMVHKMASESRSIMERMNDIVWSLKTPGDGANSFAVKLRNYTTELLATKGIFCDFQVEDAISNRLKNPFARKNVLLIAKEAVNNIAKYSGATHCAVILKRVDAGFVLQIIDNGHGFDTSAAKGGNGLRNMRIRCEELGGKWELSSVPGTQISCTFPKAVIGYRD